MEAQEGFSFQPINGGSTPVIESPPLWSLSSEHDGSGNIDCSSGKETSGAHRKSNSCWVESKRINDGEEDEKMDMLWEDFNEELLKNLSSRFGYERLPELEYSESEEAKEDVGGALLSARMASVVVIMKMLKKLLFLHSFRRKLKARTW